MVTRYALFKRWIQKADRLHERKEGLSCFELKKRSIFFYINLWISAKSHTQCAISKFFTLSSSRHAVSLKQVCSISIAKT
jgi:hypothetical protein